MTNMTKMTSMTNITRTIKMAAVVALGAFMFSGCAQKSVGEVKNLGMYQGKELKTYSVVIDDSKISKESTDKMDKEDKAEFAAVLADNIKALDASKSGDVKVVVEVKEVYKRGLLKAELYSMPIAGVLLKDPYVMGDIKVYDANGRLIKSVEGIKAKAGAHTVLRVMAKGMSAGTTKEAYSDFADIVNEQLTELKEQKTIATK